MMSAQRGSVRTPRPMVGPLFLAVAGVALTAAYFSGASLPLIQSDRGMFIALAALGWLGCTIAVGPASQALGWGHPVCIAAAGLGAVALAVIGSVLLGLIGDRVAIVALGAVLLTKVGLGLAVALRG